MQMQISLDELKEKILDLVVMQKKYKDKNYSAKICEDARPIDNNGTIPKDKQPVIESVKVID